jgi:hypothetical protein
MLSEETRDIIEQQAADANFLRDSQKLIKLVGGVKWQIGVYGGDSSDAGLKRQV